MNNEQMLIKCRDPRKCRFYAEYLNHKYPNEFPHFAPDNPQNCIRNVNLFLKEKYYKASNNSFGVFGSTAEEALNNEINELEIIAGQAILPEESFLWLKTDELATFFTWTTIYLSKEDHTKFPKINHNSSGIKNGIEVRKIRTVTDETLNTYKKSNLPDNPSSHNERIKVIISYFDSCHSLINKNAKSIYLEELRQAWLKKKSACQKFKWLLPDDDEMCQWFWTRLKQKQDEKHPVHNPVTRWFIPSSTKEYYLASLVAFALWKEAPDTIELFRTRINHAWHQKKQKDKYRSDGKKAINIHIRSNVKEMLDELRTVYGLRTGEFFEMLITEKYLEHKRRK
ncbi:transcriptional regulator [Escherichia coli]|uniref:transcriptional regulator n=1 Tax=Escherichia coli TaxID=562 RepID=UPI001483419B|nr:transcriptional regulator [Escherichia coli]NNR85066.1 transcriptional regulator [Escherichia coli]